MNLLNYPEDKFNKLDMLKRHKKYTCYIPKYQDATSENQDEDLDQKFEPYLVPLLSNCLRKWEGWWTYEFCYGKHMKQFHLDKAGNTPKDANFVLGYDPVEVGELPQLTGLSANDEGEESSADEEEDDELHAQGHRTGGGMFDTGDEEMEEELKNTLERLGIKIEDLEEDEVDDADAQLDAADRDEDEKVENRVRVKKFKVKATNTEEKQEPVKKQKLEGKDYFAIKYIKGTQCDLQDIPREAEIRFYCMPGSETSAITEIKEPATCHYTVRIDTPLICRHPKFKKALMQPEKIHCYSHSVTQNNLLEEPDQGQKHEDTSSEDNHKPTDLTAAQSTSENEQEKNDKVESQSERIRKRIQEKREQQKRGEEGVGTVKATTEVVPEQQESSDKQEEKDEELASKLRDEL